MHDIHINGKKCKAFVVNKLNDTPDSTLYIGHDRYPLTTTDEEIRYLGIWFGAKFNKKRWLKRLNNLVKDFVQLIEYKSLSNGHLAYLINRVLIPRLTYVGQLMTLSEHEWDQVFQPVIGIV
jgi:hypothetical protein